MLEPETPGDLSLPPAAKSPVETLPPAGQAANSAITPAVRPDETTPADLAPPPRRWERFAWYLGAALLSVVLVAAGLRLDRADLRAPFYYDLDSLLILPMVKSTADNGFGGHWRNERMGAPGVQELYDFPVIDHLHFAIIWVMSKVIANVALLYNLYYLLTFPLTVLTAMIVFRHLGLTLPAAAVGGLLYTFLPYHYQRWENHYFLSAYWYVPLSLLPVFAILKGNFPFFRRQPDGTYQLRLLSWHTFGQVVLAAGTASAGAYYAFFTCALIAFAGVYSWVAFRTWRAMASASGAAALIVVFGLINHLPTYLHSVRDEVNPITRRFPEEVDIYGLKLSQLLLPCEDHNLGIFRHVKAMYNAAGRPAENENRSASLGAIGVVALIGLVTILLLPGPRRGWPFGPIACITLFAVLLASIGGFGAVFNVLVTPSIRAYNRISVFIGFLCLLALLWAIDRFLVTRTGWARRLRYPAWGLLLIVGFFDQTPYSWFRSPITKSLDEQAKRFHADARFFAQIEEQMPGGKVFCLPYMPFPEVPPLHKMEAYEHARGYVHTNTAVWSYGAIKGREADAWQGDVATPLHKGMLREMLLRLVAKGFDGLFVDGRGFPPSPGAGPGKEPPERSTAALLISEIQQIYATELGRAGARLPEITHESREQFFVDLRPYRELYAQKNPEAFREYETREREWVAVLWLGGFGTAETFVNPRNAEYRDGPQDARVWFINPADRTRKFRLTMKFGVSSSGPFLMNLSGLVSDDFPLNKEPGDWEKKQYTIDKGYEFELPPGHHAIRIRCTPPADFVFSDSRKMCYFIKEFRMTEIPMK